MMQCSDSTGTDTWGTIVDSPVVPKRYVTAKFTIVQIYFQLFDMQQ